MAQGINYSKEDIEKMQKDAINRVNEMKERSRRTVRNSNFWNYNETPSVSYNNANTYSQENIHKDSKKPIIIDKQEEKESGLKQIFSLLTNLIEDDTILILMLIFVLSNEEADNELIIALVYLLI